jgi:hypothetical protein
MQFSPTASKMNYIRVRIAINKPVDGIGCTDLRIFCLQPVQALLNDVIAVQVLDQLHNLALQSMDDGLDLLRGGDEFNHFLQGSGSMLVQRNLNQARCSRLDEHGTLLIVCELEKPLAEIIAKRIWKMSMKETATDGLRCTHRS